MSDPSNNPDYVSCYNCTGSKAHIMCGFPMHGCRLCEAHGDGHGNLLKEFRYRTVEVPYLDADGVEQILKFEPPAYSCLWCKDTKKVMRKIWDPELVMRGCSDGGDHRMPRFEVACHTCCPEQSEAELRSAKLTYFTAKGKPELANDS